MSFHTPKAIQNVGIFYCYTGQNMIPKKKYFPSHYRHCSWRIYFLMTYGQYEFISLFLAKTGIFLISFYQYHKRKYGSKTNVN